MVIPRDIQSLQTRFRRATPEDDPEDIMEFTQEQIGARLAKQFVDDKQKAVRRILSEIEIVEEQIKNGSLPQLIQHLNHLQIKRDELLRDEILNLQKSKQ